MKKRIISILLTVSMFTLQGCAALSYAKEQGETHECPSCGYIWTVNEAGEIIPVEQLESIIERPSVQETETAESQVVENTTQTQQSEEVVPEQEIQPEQQVSVGQLTEGERQARVQLQANLKAARDEVYKLPNSVDKMIQINKLDQQILVNNAYDFSDKTVQFIGDSITEGVTASVAEDGTKLTYMEYANRYLQIGNLMVNGKAGRMYNTYGGDEYSVVQNINTDVYYDADVYVVYLGVNDYLSLPTDGPKRYGDIDNTLSTAGYCGAVRQFMKFMKQYFGDREVFFVLAYPLDIQAVCEYSDVMTPPTLNDYLDIQRRLAVEYGFHVIDLYNIGFMDCTSAEVKNYFLADEVHPSDAGYKVLGEHIAAELSLYLGQK